MKKERVFIWMFISKNALSSGIEKIEGHFLYDSNRFYSKDNMLNSFKKGEYHETLEEAIKQAESMRIKKIESLKKQIAKIEKLNFIDTLKIKK